jgi:diamine N-acetyltransferase
MLSNELITLRAPEPEDLEMLYEWENMLEYWETGNTRQPYSRFALKQYIIQCDQDIYSSQHLRLMIQDQRTGITVGTVDLFDFDIHHSRIALGLFVAPEHKGKGYATSALHLTESYVFDFLKINQLYCHIATNNTPSIRMFTKENFDSVVLQQWIKASKGYQDVVLFQQLQLNYQRKKALQIMAGKS